MKRHWRTGMVGLFGVAAVVGLGGCSSSSGPATCPETDKVAGVCAGVPADDVCGNDTCTSVIDVASDADLQAKAKAAAQGACLALAPGKDKTVTLPGGVSLLGRSAADVTVNG